MDAELYRHTSTIRLVLPREAAVEEETGKKGCSRRASLGNWMERDEAAPLGVSSLRRIYIVGGMRPLSAAASIISPNEDAHRHPRAYPEARYYMPLSRGGARAIFGRRNRHVASRRRADF